MPKKTIKVVNVIPDEPSNEQEEPLALTGEQEQDPVVSPDNSVAEADMNSEDLDRLVEEYTKERKLKQKKEVPKAECEYCGKQMSSKSLKYSHIKSCKSKPVAAEPEPEPLPEPEVLKPKRKTPVRRTIKKAEPQQPAEIHPPLKEDIKEPFTTSYLRVSMLRKSEHLEQKMKNLASQAF